MEWELKRNNCKSCPATGNNCGQHRQSPIDLERDRGIPNHDNYKECFDYHWMAYEDGACTWDDIVDNPTSEFRNNFFIQRHALQILQPLSTDGVLQCENHLGRRFPRLDYSKGFPNWWHLSHTEVTVPSEHTQQGKRYDAEVHLIHFYSVKHERKVCGAMPSLAITKNVVFELTHTNLACCAGRKGCHLSRGGRECVEVGLFGQAHLSVARSRGSHPGRMRPPECPRGVSPLSESPT